MTRPNPLHLAAVLLTSACLALWFAQESVNTYWRHTYHRPSPIQGWSAFAPWQAGSRLRALLESPLQLLASWRADGIRLSKEPAPLPAPPAMGTAAPPTHPAPSALPAPVAAAEADTAEPQRPSVGGVPAIPLSAGNMVLFAGDSMMEGIAPHSQRFLQHSYGIASINLSRQSTGLSYPSLFDWPATIEKQLAQNPRIRAVVVFLGPNDPWDFPNPQGGRAYLKFQSPEWESVYRGRVRRIAEAARRHNAHLVWLEIPPMRKSRLHEQTRYLNRIIADELHGHALWLSTAHPIGATPDGQYSETAEYAGKAVRVRSKDGIHFTLKGQQILAGHLNSHFVPTTTYLPAHRQTMPEASRQGLKP